jgi:hypothetical protein
MLDAVAEAPASARLTCQIAGTRWRSRWPIFASDTKDISFQPNTIDLQNGIVLAGVLANYTPRKPAASTYRT